MPVLNRIAGFADEMEGWRKHLHATPELGFELHETAAYVAERLRACGVDELHEGIARTGMVALIRGRAPGPVIGLRADMDALPILETTGAAHASTAPGKMHACGHDGHTTMLLGAAKYLAETRNFAGTVALIFQPAEEQGGGGGVMVAEGVMDRFGIERVFAMHNAPEMAEGTFTIGPGPILASVDNFTIHIKGLGGHAAVPSEARDPIMAAVSMVQAIQTISSRNRASDAELIVSVTQIHAGTTDNVIPETAMIQGTVRGFDTKVTAMVERRLRGIVAGQAASFDVAAELDYQKEYPATINDEDCALFAADVARDVVGDQRVAYAEWRSMGAEDFAFMLNARPGAYVMLGQGPGAGLHQPDYDFNDRIAPIGASWFARLAERALPLVAGQTAAR